MVTIKISFPHTDKPEVIPLVSPTVATADTTSYSVSSKAHPSVIKSSVLDTNVTPKAIITTHKAVRRLSAAIFRPNISVLLRPFITAATISTIMTIVVVFTPPAEPMGEPPINMRIKVSSTDGLVNSFWEMV